MRLAGRLWEFWLMHGEIEEGQGWIVRLLMLFGQAEPTLWKAHLLNGLGMLKNASRDDPSKYFHESLAIFRKMGDRYGEAWVLNHLAEGTGFALQDGTYDQVDAYLEESLRLFQELNAEWNIAWVLHNMARLEFYRDNFVKAESCIHRGLHLFQHSGDQRGIALSHTFLAGLARERNDIPTAIKHLMSSIDLLNHIRDISGVAWRNISLAELLLKKGDINDAQASLLKSLQLFRQKGNLNLGVARSLIGLSQVGLKNGNYEPSLSMLAAAAALLKQSDVYRGDFERGLYSPLEQELRQHLGSEKYEHLWREGQKDPIAIVNLIENGGWGRNILHHLPFNLPKPKEEKHAAHPL